jgi:hypothetical protein
MLFALSGSGPADFSVLAQRPLRAVRTAEDGRLLVFDFLTGDSVAYSAEGDCCSYSWVEHLTTPEALTGAVIDAVRDGVEVGEKPCDGGRIAVYQTSFRTDRGEIIVEYRNESNGYYGGWLSGPVTPPDAGES